MPDYINATIVKKDGKTPFDYAVDIDVHFLRVLNSLSVNISFFLVIIDQKHSVTFSFTFPCTLERKGATQDSCFIRVPRYV